MSLVLAAGSRRVSIVSVNARLGGRAQQKPGRARLEIGRVKRLAVQSGGDEHQFVAIERERRALTASGIGAQRQGRDHARRMDVERHVKLDVVDEIVRDAIVAEANRLSVRRAHGRPFEVLGIAGGDQAGAKPIIAAGVNASP